MIEIPSWHLLPFAETSPLPRDGEVPFIRWASQMTVNSVPLPTQGTSEVHIELVTKMAAAGDVGDGSKISQVSIAVSGNPYDLLHLKKQFAAGDPIIKHDDQFAWRLYTARLSGRTDWARINDELQAIVHILSGLLKVLRRARQPLVGGAMLWHGTDGSYGPIYPAPAGMRIAVVNESTITYTEQQP